MHACTHTHKGIHIIHSIFLSGCCFLLFCFRYNIFAVPGLLLSRWPLDVLVLFVHKKKRKKSIIWTLINDIKDAHHFWIYHYRQPCQQWLVPQMTLWPCLGSCRPLWRCCVSAVRRGLSSSGCSLMSVSRCVLRTSHQTSLYTICTWATMTYNYMVHCLLEGILDSV